MKGPRVEHWLPVLFIFRPPLLRLAHIPTITITPVFASRNANRNGLSTVIFTKSTGAERVLMTAVAAAASAPASSTRKTAFCTTGRSPAALAKIRKAPLAKAGPA